MFKLPAINAAALLIVTTSLMLSVVAFPSIQRHADELVQELRELPTPLPGMVPGDGRLPAIEVKRRELYRDIRRLGADALPALERGLHDDDDRVRRNVAIVFLGLAGGGVDGLQPKMNVRTSLASLILALGDSNAYVRDWVAQAIGAIGPDAADAIPALITLLKNNDEGSRNSACIGLRGIGRIAKDALPALQDAASHDSSDTVRRFARIAIETIEKY